ncbi:hypothetical protein [Alienimonas sp. DA493]|uniref:hypothetical protein n=1 Tax=Alienimonas sp. DA493 TaxID=3373605 RepID=UPI003753F23F
MPHVLSAAVDRPARDRLAAAVRAFLDGELWAFAFDETIWEIRDATDDPTVQAVCDRLWYHYDDCDDHAAALSREEWNYFQRLLLILESDAHLIETRRRIWSPTQCLAALGVAITAACVWGVVAEQGWGTLALAGFLPGYLLSVAIYFVNREAATRLMNARETAAPIPYGAIAPFDSVAELADVHRATPRFRKRRFPPEVGERRIRARSSAALIQFQMAISWFFGTPFVLLSQLFPAEDTASHVLQSAGSPVPEAS